MNLNNFNYSEKHNVLWLAPPRTGSRGLCRVFNFLGFKYEGFQVMSENGPYHTHDFPKQNIQTEYKTVISVRNPYGRLYSLYHNYFGSNNYIQIPFDEYVSRLDESILKHDAFGIFNLPSEYVIRVENQLEDLIKIPFVYNNLSIKQLELMTQHGKPLHDWTKEYNQEMKSKVYNLFKYQFTKYGYEK